MAVSTMTGYADHLERDGRAITGAASAAGLAAPIPSCPQWTMTDLLHHVEQAGRGISALVSLGVTEVPGAPPPLPPPAGGDPVAGFGEQVAVLVSTLRDTRPDKPVWNWPHGAAHAGPLIPPVRMRWAEPVIHCTGPGGDCGRFAAMKRRDP